jgi:uridine kinase
VGDQSATLAHRLAVVVDELTDSGPVTVAFDGPDAAGKTWLADLVAAEMSAPVCRASVDGFHAPAEARARRGHLSAEGYYRDSFDYDALTRRLLTPFRAGAAEVETKVFDYRTDMRDPRPTQIGPGTALLVDGVFLLRPELRDQWTLRIYLHVSEQETLARALQRDLALFGSEQALLARYQRRYLPGQALYRAEASPHECAHIVIDNDDPRSPNIVKWKPPA